MAENTPLSGALVSSPTDPAVIHKLLADPEFQSLNSDQKKELLLSADPVFADFNGADIEKFAATKPRQQSIDEAMAKALQKNKGAGNFPTVAEPTLGRRLAQVAFPPLALYDAATGRDPGTEALAQGAAETIFAGTPEAIAARSGVDINEPNSPKFTNPYLYSAGEIGGAFLPLGEIGKGVTATKEGIKQAIKQGMRIGGVYGVGSAVSTEAKKEEPELNKALSKAVTGGATGVALGGVVGAGAYGLLSLPQIVAKYAQGKQNKITEALDKATKEVTDAETAQTRFEDKLSNDIQQAIIERDKGATKAAQEAEQKNIAQTLSEEELSKLQREAQARAGEARTITLQTEPEIAARQAALEESGQFQQGILNALPAAPEPSQLGRAVVSGTQRELKLANQDVTKAYNAVKAALPESQPLLDAPNLQNTVARLQEEERAGLGLPDQALRVLDAISKKKSGGLPLEVQRAYDSGNEVLRAAIREQYPEAGGGFNWTSLQKTFQDLNEKMGPALAQNDRASVRIYTQLKNAINDDMQSYADQVGGDVKALFDQAKAKYIAKEEKFGTSRVEPILAERALENPNIIADKIVKDNNAPMVENLKDILSPEEFSLIQSSYVNKLFSPSKDVPFDPSHFINQFDKIEDETVRAVLGPDGLQGMTNLYNASKGLDAIASMEKEVASANNLAQKAQDAFASAKSQAEKNTILSRFKSDSEKELDRLESLLDETKAAGNDLKTEAKRADLKASIEEARKALDKAQNPIQIPAFVKVATSLAIFGTAYHYHHGAIGTLIATAHLLGSGKFEKAFISPLALSALKRATNPALSQAETEIASRELAKIIIKESGTVSKRVKKLSPKEQKMADSIQKAIDKQAAESIPK